MLVLLVPVVAAVFIARTATLRLARRPCGCGRRSARGPCPGTRCAGLSVTGRSVYAVLEDDNGAVRLPCVGTADLAAVAKASGGRLPEIREPVRKFAPSRRRRR